LRGVNLATLDVGPDVERVAEQVNRLIKKTLAIDVPV
jgi:hypothetical protein